VVAASAPLASERAGVRLVHDHELGAAPRELIAPSLSLDEVHRHNGMGIEVEERLADATAPFQPRGRRGQDGLSFDVELVSEFLLPLLGEVRRTKDGQPLGLSTIEKLPGNEGGFDRLPDADVVGDEETDRIE